MAERGLTISFRAIRFRHEGSASAFGDSLVMIIKQNWFEQLA
jgi:hypothetical protein